MTKKFSFIFLGIMLLSMVLTACGGSTAPVAAPTQVVLEAPAKTEAPAAPAKTEAPAPTQPPAPTEPPAPTPEPAPDMLAVFTKVIADLPPEKSYGTVGAKKVSEDMASATPPFLLDVREAAEVEKDGYIKGAVNIPVRAVLRNLDKLPGLDDPMIVYCGSGHRGGLTMAALRALGYTNVSNLAGGLGAWKKANLPVEMGSKPAEPQVLNPKAIVADQAMYELLDGFMSKLPEDYNLIKAADLAEAIKGDKAPTIIDVRSIEERTNDGYIEGSIHIPFNDVLTSLDKLPAKDQPVVLYCGSGARGAVIQEALLLSGYSDVRNLASGFNGWKMAGQPVAGIPDWKAIWGEFLAGMPEDLYVVKDDVLARELSGEKPPFLVDVRETTEISKTGYIKGAINLPIRNLLKNLDKLPAKDQPMVIYCGSGHRGAMGMAALRILGYTDVRNLAGGMNRWKADKMAAEPGLPAEPVAGTAPEVDAQVLKGLDSFLSTLPDNFYGVSAGNLYMEITGAKTVTETVAMPETPPMALVDLRTPEEIANAETGGTIQGAQNIEIQQLFENLDKLPTRDKAIVAICQSGHRGAIAMMALRMIYYANVRSLMGGMNAWNAAKLPVVK